MCAPSSGTQHIRRARHRRYLIPAVLNQIFSRLCTKPLSEKIRRGWFGVFGRHGSILYRYDGVKPWTKRSCRLSDLSGLAKRFWEVSQITLRSTPNHGRDSVSGNFWYVLLLKIKLLHRKSHASLCLQQSCLLMSCNPQPVEVGVIRNWKFFFKPWIKIYDPWTFMRDERSRFLFVANRRHAIHELPQTVPKRRKKGYIWCEIRLYLFLHSRSVVKRWHLWSSAQRYLRRYRHAQFVQKVESVVWWVCFTV